MKSQKIYTYYSFFSDLEDILTDQKRLLSGMIRKNSAEIKRLLRVEVDQGEFVDGDIKDVEIIVSSNEARECCDLEHINWYIVLRDLSNIHRMIIGFLKEGQLEILDYLDYVSDSDGFYNLASEEKEKIKEVIIVFLKQYGFPWESSTVVADWTKRFFMLSSAQKSGQLLENFFEYLSLENSGLSKCLVGKKKPLSVMLLSSFLGAASLAYKLEMFMEKSFSLFTESKLEKEAITKREDEFIQIAELSQQLFKAKDTEACKDNEISLSLPTLSAAEWSESNLENLKNGYVNSINKISDPERKVDQESLEIEKQAKIIEIHQKMSNKYDHEIQKLVRSVDEDLISSLAHVFLNKDRNLRHVEGNRYSTEQRLLKKVMRGFESEIKNPKFFPLLKIVLEATEEKRMSLFEKIVFQWLGYLEKPLPLKQCEYCKKKFLQTDKRQRFCPPFYDGGKSLCGQNFRQRKFRGK